MDPTSISSAGTALSTQRFQAEASVAVVRRTQDNQKLQGEAAVRLIDAATAQAPREPGMTGSIINVTA